MDYHTLESYINQGLSLNKIAKEMGMAVSTIVYWKNKFNLQSSHKSINQMNSDELRINALLYGNLKPNQVKRNKQSFDWVMIQQDHDAGLSYRALCKKYSLNKAAIAKAKTENKFVTVSEEILYVRSSKRAFNRKHSQETKNKISKARKEWLANNPDKHYWITSTGPFHISIPCKILQSELIDAGIEFITEYQPLLHKKRFFSIDIFLPKLNLGIEVNGRQHYNSDHETLAPYYQNRHELIEKEGITLLEIKASNILSKMYVKGFISDLLILLN